MLRGIVTRATCSMPIAQFKPCPEVQKRRKKGKWSHGKRKYMCEIHSPFVKIYAVHPNILDLKLQNAK
jgi:hypothetical protein